MPIESSYGPEARIGTLRRAVDVCVRMHLTEMADDLRLRLVQVIGGEAPPPAGSPEAARARYAEDEEGQLADLREYSEERFREWEAEIRALYWLICVADTEGMEAWTTGIYETLANYSPALAHMETEGPRLSGTVPHDLLEEVVDASGIRDVLLACLEERCADGEEVDLDRPMVCTLQSDRSWDGEVWRMHVRFMVRGGRTREATVHLEDLEDAANLRGANEAFERFREGLSERWRI